MVSPLGIPTWSQNRVPLGLPVETFEDGKLDAPQRVGVEASVPTSAHLDWFSPGSFVELTEAEAMALPAFERHQAGVVVTLAVTRSAPVTKDVTFEEIRLPSTRRVVDGLTIPGHVLDRMQAVDAPPAVRPRPPRFGLARRPLPRRDRAGHGRGRRRRRRVRPPHRARHAVARSSTPPTGSSR